MEHVLLSLFLDQPNYTVVPLFKNVFPHQDCFQSEIECCIESWASWFSKFCGDAIWTGFLLLYSLWMEVCTLDIVDGKKSSELKRVSVSYYYSAVPWKTLPIQVTTFIIAGRCKRYKTLIAAIAIQTLLTPQNVQTFKSILFVST